MIFAKLFTQQKKSNLTKVTAFGEAYIVLDAGFHRIADNNISLLNLIRTTCSLTYIHPKKFDLKIFQI